MKRILKVTTALALLLITGTGLAKESEIGLTTTKQPKSLVLTLENKAKDLTLSITDTDKNILYSEKMKNGSITKKFDLSSLKNGIYYLTTSDTSKLVVYTVSILGNEVDIMDKKETVKPHFRKTEEKMFVNFLNLDQSNVDIKVYDEEYRLVFAETIAETMVIEKAFNFQGAYKGNYRVVVSDTNETYSENFIVE